MMIIFIAGAITGVACFCAGYGLCAFFVSRSENHETH